MNHDTCRERLLDLVHGELPRREVAEVERHLSDCEPCRVERARLSSTLDVMRRLETPPPPDRVDVVVLAAARRAAEERRRDSFGLALRGFGVRVAAGTAFAVVAVFLLVNVRQGLRSPSEDVARQQAGRRGGAPAPAPSGEAPTVAPAPTPSRPEEAGTLRRDQGHAALKGPAAGAPERRRSTIAERDGSARGEGGAAMRPERESRDQPQAAAAPSQEEGALPPPATLSRELAPGGARGERPAAPGRPEPLASAAPDEPGPRPAGAPAPAASRARAVSRVQDRSSEQPRASPAPAGAWGREVERRHAAGELSEAQKRFDPCPGGDVRRTAWIDGAQRILKLTRERADGFVVEEWFDDSGRLREALVRGPAAGGTWSRRVVVAESGEESSRDVSDSGLAPEAPPPALVKRDPSGAFFSGAGCSR